MRRAVVHLIVAVGVVAAASCWIGVALASATDAAVTYAQKCDRATVTITSAWDGGTIHGTITGPSPSIEFDVPPQGSTPVTFTIRPNPLTVTVSSTNGHLHGDLSHTFTADYCGAPTTPPAPTTAPGIVPGPTTAPTTTTTAPAPTTAPPAPDSTTAPPPAASIEQGSAAPVSPPAAHVPPALPATGLDARALAMVAVVIMCLGYIAVETVRRNRRPR